MAMAVQLPRLERCSSGEASGASSGDGDACAEAAPASTSSRAPSSSFEGFGRHLCSSSRDSGSDSSSSSSDAASSGSGGGRDECQAGSSGVSSSGNGASGGGGSSGGGGGGSSGSGGASSAPHAFHSCAGAGGMRSPGRQSPRGACASALALLLALCLAAPRGAAAFGTEISSSVALFRYVDLNVAEYLSGTNATRCVHMVNRAGRTGSSKINFVISHYFVDEDKDFVVDYYCLKLEDSPKCSPATPELVARWTSLFKPCLKYAVDMGFDIAFTPHLDDGLNNGQWRNAMRINPVEKYGGMSYFDVVLGPLAEAMGATLLENTRVWYALQGEMSAMVTSYPREHRKLLPYIKQIILGDHPEWADNVRVGVSTNFNKLCGMEACQAADVKKMDVAGMKELYDAVDFVGISSYPRYHGKLAEMEDSTQMFDQELKLFGIDLVKLINTEGKEFVFNEFGIGGGASVSGDAPARTWAQVDNGPFFGVYGPYTRKLDPWRLFLPYNVLVGTRQAMHEWYTAATMWLARKGGPTWRVDHVFMWNLNSWDVQAIHMESTTKEGSYRDEAVYGIIRSHNLMTRGLTGYDAPGSLPPY